MNPPLSRRTMLAKCSSGFGLMALHGLNSLETKAENTRPFPQHQGKAKNVILCYMSGGFSHIDTFDPKPRLKALAGKPMPVNVERTQFNNNGNVFPSPFDFKHCGQSGIEISSMFPKIQEWCADDLTVIRSMTTKLNEHAQGNFAFHTGFPFIGHPSAGAWINYGLGNLNHNMPGYVVLQSGGAVPPHGGVGLFSNGFLPAHHQASIIKVDAKEAVANITPKELDTQQQTRLNFIHSLDQKFLKKASKATQVEAAIRNYETAYRMQAAVPELTDLRGETNATKKLYGLDDPHPQKAAYAHQCLMARRLVERGVRFIELSCLTESIGAGGAANPWDQHGDLARGHGAMGNQVDHAVSAFIQDVHERGLSEKILLVVTGEMGRSPRINSGGGRNHYGNLTSLLVSGGGLKMGQVIGQSDRQAAEPATRPYDPKHLMSTIMHTLFDIGQLRVKGGLPKSLVDVITGGSPIQELI
ncbi:MAG: DUF1501 domain-containing protein [Verrucomicrobia bacterium]|nr:DUF1501 domain-containing protein [Verrucomicrobiota bacterium]